ncbi:hypothetical protein APHAL10511_003925 [Amanita phalloides]|nr:hypothetical protein APHAL10511_003925 [Amanita phalloides]
MIPKRTRSQTESDDDTGADYDAIQRAKRRTAARREEVSIAPGETLTPGFHSIHYALHASDVYMPLSLFTNNNLRMITRESGSLDFKKIYTSGLSGKQARVLDTSSFDKKYGPEQELSHPRWAEAANNFVKFTESLGDEDWSNCWLQHFQYLNS